MRMDLDVGRRGHVHVSYKVETNHGRSVHLGEQHERGLLNGKIPFDGIQAATQAGLECRDLFVRDKQGQPLTLCTCGQHVAEIVD